jgi:hypothetical protein
MRGPASVSHEIAEDGAVVLRFHAHQEFRGLNRRHTYAPAYSGNQPYVGSLTVWFRRADPSDPASPPIAVEAVSLWEPDGITPTELQRFAWSRWLTVADAIARDADAAPAKVTRAIYEEHGAPLPSGKRPGRKGRPPEFYEQIATRYKELRAAGERSPTKAIVEELRRSQNEWVSRNTVAGWIKRARELGYLQPGRRGRPG